MENDSKLHVIVFPWLAFGHINPALQLSKCLAAKGHHVSFVSTPRNIQRLPAVPPTLSPLITLIKLSLPPTEHLPKNAEASSDIPPGKATLLTRAFDGLQPQFAKFLESSPRPADWIIYDYQSHWLPALAAQHDIPCAFFSTFNASSLSFLGPPKLLLSTVPEESRFTSLESFTTVPKWITFPSNVVYRLHEILPLLQHAESDIYGSPDDVPYHHRFGVAIRDCQFIALRSCVELEAEWIKLLAELTEKPVIPVGSLHPATQDYQDEKSPDEEQKWLPIKEWLDKQNNESVLYVALGTEARLTENQISEMAIGLEKSNLPFFWVLRTPHNHHESSADKDVITMLPDGFLDRTRDRGIVWTNWAPQVNILAHPSVRGMLSHCGWSSINEALGFGRFLVLMPMTNDQGLIARLLESKMLGLEVPRDLRDGSFTSDSVAESVRKVMVDKEGEVFRANAKHMEGWLGDKMEMAVIWTLLLIFSESISENLSLEWFLFRK